jgi:hypothetical protein
MVLHWQNDWVPLLGRAVEVRLYNQAVRTGTVDAVTADGNILWLASHSLHLRRMFARHDGYTVWTHYDWE